ncbi:hypothetical protein H3H36_19575 [Duganella sp. FT3S]|uniref:Lipoprotein n=1 Tax=Rugamonas fusca TaxID=2758568 RepID=A0A7W2EKH3_9BURK|nr:hypothetical protein [Rugamonas fusca]MBA5607561.1 hypothetical protein [Rugamonas fusca]
MKRVQPALTLALLTAALACAPVQAQTRPHRGGGHPGGHVGGYSHSRTHVGVVIGAPLFWPAPWYADPFYDPFYRRYYYYDPVYPVPAPPPVYIEQGAPPVPPVQFWYYCNNPPGYYPYVKECRSSWRAVSPEEVKPKPEPAQ